ncbi:hypothetical protein CsatB_014290 [Cannabis sativa]|uniref:uncharacterized protein LOC115695159 n=1 Tax=Cannabis sativa TaxID=3483 RepID=UPI0011E06242|nr:uncharacterized protein LOC115695159 [Cannabis sativa]
MICGILWGCEVGNCGNGFVELRLRLGFSVFLADFSRKTFNNYYLRHNIVGCNQLKFVKFFITIKLFAFRQSPQTGHQLIRAVMVSEQVVVFLLFFILEQSQIRQWKITTAYEDDDDYDSWCRCNSTVISWILRAISDEIADSIVYHDNAAEIWAELHEQFNERNAPQIFEAKKMMQSLVQGSNTFTTYYTRLKSLWDQIRELRPPPVCFCGAVKVIQEYKEEDRLLEFLVGLNDSYSLVRSQILMRDPLPSVNKAYAVVIQEERQRNLTNNYSNATDQDKGSNGQVTGSVNNGQFAGAVQPFRSKYNCTHCGMNGHSIERCYKLNRYPPGHKYHGKFPNRDGKGNPGKPAGVNFSGADEGKAEEPTMERDLISSLSSVQCQKLMAILAQKATENNTQNVSEDQPDVSHFSSMKIYTPSSYWIIDTGATHHV